MGTSACLCPSDVLPLLDLLYGLMLPSGNDAATALAEYFGRLLHRELLEDQPASSCPPPKPTFVKYFLGEVNGLARELGLSDSRITNPHGLMSKLNYSSARDVALLSAIAMRNTLFRTIVGTEMHSCRIYNQTSGLHRQISWINTNKLLGIKPFFGIKTGVTPSAGPCFAAQY
jgi:D-alanyl-D-alanine carboxypeptidase (penicillin-binding protein 5/6)